MRSSGIDFADSPDVVVDAAHECVGVGERSIQLDRLLQAFDRLLVAAALHVNERERPIHFRDVGIDHAGRTLRARTRGPTRSSFARRPQTMVHRVSHRQSCVGARELRVQLDRLPIEIAGLFVDPGLPNEEQRLRAQEVVVRFEAARVAVGQPLSVGVGHFPGSSSVSLRTISSCTANRSPKGRSNRSDHSCWFVVVSTRWMLIRNVPASR